MVCVTAGGNIDVCDHAAIGGHVVVICGTAVTRGCVDVGVTTEGHVAVDVLFCYLKPC